MTTFKFVCRDNEIQEVISSIKENPLAILHSQNNSGLTHFLKQVMRLLWRDDSAAFYINGESRLTLSEQVIGQVMSFSKEDSPAQNSAAKLLKKYNKGDIVYSIATSCLFALDAIPLLPNIGTIANSLITSLRETIDADHEHLNDFKKEKAIARFCEKLSKKEKKHLYFVIDNSEKLDKEEYPFISLLLDRYDVHVLFTFHFNSRLNEVEFISKFHSVDSHAIYRLPSDFERPDNRLIEALYQCYGSDFLPEKLKTFNRYERNIHIIMADIFGMPLDFHHFDPPTQYLLKVLSVFQGPVPKSVLFSILRMENLKSQSNSDEFFWGICQQMIQCGIVQNESRSDGYDCTFALKSYVNDLYPVRYVEKLNITQAAIKVLDRQIDTLDIPMLEFAICNLEHDYSHCKQYILAHAKLQNKRGQVSLELLDRLQFFEDPQELFFVVGLYYDCKIYDKPYRLLQTHKGFARKQVYKIAQAMICERLHTDDYVIKLEELYSSIKHQEKKCLLAVILFVAYLNSDEDQKYKCFFDKNSKYFYKAFAQCGNYSYLLRNVSYYIDDVQTAMNNYEECLRFFQAKDPVSYNRAISNYFCYLMRKDSDGVAKKRLESIADEVRCILDYCDPAYTYLNINYGIYLMHYTEEDPVAYFSSIPFSAGTTETPFIYAQINLAVYYLKINPILALRTMDDIEAQVINTSVPRTRQFYAINRAVVEYANGIIPNDRLSEMMEKPLRGNFAFAQTLCNRYQELIENGTPVNWQVIKELSMPGYIFYRYFKAEKLLSDF